MNASASRSSFTARSRIFDRLYKLKYDAPFVAFTIVTKNKRRYPIKRPQDLAFPPNGKGQMFVIWRAGKCKVLKFDDVSLLEPE
jgi:hypothetical protein